MYMVSRWRTTGRDHQRAELPPDPGPPAALAAGDDQRPFGSERPPQPGQAVVAADVEDQVIVPVAVGEVGPGVVDDLVSTASDDRCPGPRPPPAPALPPSWAGWSVMTWRCC